MANDKKFIVKNGLQTDNNVLVGTSTDDGVNKLQVTGAAKVTGTVEVTQATPSTASLTATNTGGSGAIIANFVGDSQSLQITNFATGDYSILNSGQSNGVKFYDNTAGVEIIYNDVVDLEFDSDGIDFKRSPTVNGYIVWHAGNDGTGSTLDADLLDGIDSLSFVRSDQDDTLDGNYVITGNLTVQGTRTEIVSETVLIADNIITLNSNFLSGTPTENSGWEVSRGDEANSSIQWDETNDWFKLISAGTDLGRIITTADEGSGNNFDADTVDGLEAAQFLRSDVNDSASGNLEFNGTVAIGNGTGSALLTMRGAGNNRVLSSDNGKIGFLDGTFAYQTYSDLNGDWTVGRNNIAERFVDKDDANYFAEPAANSIFNNLGLDSDLFHNGNANTKISFGTDTIQLATDGTTRLTLNNSNAVFADDIIAPRMLDSTDNTKLIDPAGTSVISNIGIDTNIFHNGDTDTDINFGTDTVNVNTGGTTRFTVGNTSATATVDVVAPKFADSADTSYFALPSGTSVMNQIDLDDYIRHNGDTNTYMGFSANDTIVLATGGTARLTATDTSVTASVNVVAPRFVDASDSGFYADPAGTSVFNDLGINDQLFHNGNTGTSLAFGTNTINLSTNGLSRVSISDTQVSSTVQLRAPVYYSPTGTTYRLDLDSTTTSMAVNAKVVVGNVGDDVRSNDTTGEGGITLAPYGTSGGATANPIFSISGGTGGLPLTSLNKFGMGNNPFAVSNLITETRVGGVTATTLRGDSFGNMYQIIDNDMSWSVTDSSANFLLTANATDGDIIIGDQAATYATMDATPVVGSKTNSILHVSGSVQLTSNDDAFAVGSGTATFLKGDELGFGSGGGFYMDDTATVKVRGDKDVSTAGIMQAAQFKDANDDTFFGDFASTSRMNNIDVSGTIRHDNDVNTNIGFPANDQIALTTGGTARLTVTDTAVTSSVDLIAPRMLDSANNSYLVDPSGTSVMSRIDLDDYIRHNGDVDSYFGFSGNDIFKVFVDNTQQLNIDDNSANFAQNVYAPAYYDSNNNSYYLDPAADSQLNTIDIDDYIRHRGDVTTLFGFDQNARFRVNTANANRLSIDNDSADFSVNVYAPRYYDSGDNAFYLDPASTSITNVIRAQEIQVGVSSMTIEPPSGPKGTIMVEGERDSYAGYMISNDWGFISSGATEMGLYNETDNEWSLLANRNNFTRLYSNNIHQIGAENGYGYAPNRMRAPIFEDSDNTAFYADLAGQSRLKSVKAGDSAIFNNTTYPLEVKSAQERMIVIQNTSADANFPSIFHNTRNSRSTMGISFNNIGERFWFEENGNFQAYGAGIFGSLALNGGNEDLGLLKTYGSGLADMKMFDASDYWDKRVIQPMQGDENNATGTTTDYVKNGDGPFASSYALRTNGFRSFDSDYIPVEPGEEIYVEQAVRFISGSGGNFFLGVRQYDKDRNPIDANEGIVYFAASSVNVTSTSWEEYKGYHTVPTSHTPYNGSDGLGVRFVRVISLMNHNTGGALRDFGPPILKRSDVQGKIKADSMAIDNSGTIGVNLDVLGTITGDTVIGVNVDATNFRDASNSTYSFNPRTGGKVAGTWDWSNGTIDNLNNLTFADPGPNEGIRWKGGNEWAIFESPDDLTTNSLGNLQFTSDNLAVGGYAAVSRATITTAGDVVASRYMDATRFRDKDNTAYYADPAGTSVFNEVRADEYIRHNGDTDTYIRFRNEDDMQLVAGGRQMLRMDEGTDPDRLRFVTDSDWTDANGDWNMSRNVSVTGTHTVLNGAYANIFYDSDDNNYYGDFGGTSVMNTVRANRFEMGSASTFIDNVSGSYGTIRVSGNTGGYAGYAINDDWVFASSGAGVAGIYNDTNNEWAQIWRQNGDVELYWDGVEQASTKNGFFLGTNEVRSPIFRDSDNSTYFGDFGGTSRFLGLTVDQVITGSVSGSSGQLRSKENLIISPSEDNGETMAFGLGTWNNDGVSPYADYLHLKSGNDAADGTDNLLMFKKTGGRGMRLYSGSFGSTTAYSSYSDLAIYNANPGGGASSQFYASKFIDSDNVSFFVDPSGVSKIKHIEVAGENLNASYSHAAIEVREYNYGGAQTDNDATAPRIGFHWGGRVASQIRLASNGEIQIRDNPGTGYEDFRADNIFAQGGSYAGRHYDRDNTAYYGDFAGTSVVNILDVRGEIYNDGWFRNDTSGRGLYSTPNNMHFYSSDNDSWRIRSAQNTLSLEFSTNADVLRGRVYATNSNEIGFLSQDGGWSLRTTNSVVDSHHSFYAPIMYDRDNTSFFVNPASDSLFSGDVRANRFVHKDAVSQDDQFGLYFATDESTAYAIYREGGGWSTPYPDLRIAFHTGIKMGANSSYNGMRFYDDYTMVNQIMSINNASDPLGGNDVFVNYSLQAGSSLRSPVFYDSNNTSRYTDPASTSQMNTIEWDQLNARDMGDFITFYGDNSRNHSISSRNASGNAADDLRINSYGSVFINLDSNNNNTSGADFMIGRHGQATNSIANSDLFRVYGDANYVLSSFSFRAPIFYDSNNTGFYCDPSSASNFATSVRADEVYARNWFRNDNSGEGLYNQNTGFHAYSYQGRYFALAGNNNASDVHVQLRAAYNGNVRMWLHGASNNYCGYLNTGGQWILRTRMQDGYSPAIEFREEGNESWTGNPGNDVGKIEYHSNRFYIVAGGNSNRIVQFRQNGSDRSYVDNNGLYVGTATSARWADLAERYSADEIYPNATVLGVNLDGDSEATLWQPGMPLLGVISTNPAVQMNDMGIEPGSNSIKAQMNPFIALKGRIPCLVSQPVKKGQWVIPDADGKAKGVDYGTVGINSYEIIGIALSDSENGEVEVKV